MKLVELFNRPSQVTKTGESDEYKSYKAQLQDGTFLNIEFMQAISGGDNCWELEFKRYQQGAMANASNKKTGEGNEVDVMSTVMNIAGEFIQKQQPNVLEFTAERPENDPRPDSRAKLYRHMAKRIAGGDYEVEEKDNGNHIFFRLNKKGFERPPANAWDWR